MTELLRRSIRSALDEAGGDAQLAWDRFVGRMVTEAAARSPWIVAVMTELSPHLIAPEETLLGAACARVREEADGDPATVARLLEERKAAIEADTQNDLQGAILRVLRVIWLDEVATRRTP